MIGKALRLIRVFNNIKACDLADNLKISASYLSEIETGKKHPPLELIYKYADFFKVKPSSILFFSEELDGKGMEKIFPESKLKTFIRGQLIEFLQSIEHARA
jgi:transcriptional regulator with XRE-family HTH domain